MGLVTELEKKVIEHIEGDYEIEDIETIPRQEEVQFGNRAKKINLCAYCIDLRKSTDLLFSHNKTTCGKIHKAFLAVASKTVLYYGGDIRSFNGDGLLAFWSGNKVGISNAVNAALTTKWFLDIRLSDIFEKYEKIDFGIGIDWSEAYIFRAGIMRDPQNNDLVFIGKCVNFATAIANQAHGQGHVEISDVFYNKLDEDSLYGKNSSGEKVNIWHDGSFEWKGENWKTKVTHWYLPIKE